MSDHQSPVKNNTNSAVYRRFRLSTVALVVASVLSAPVHADDSKDTTINAKSKPERISVTGSKIRSVNAMAPTSVTSISAEALEMTGHVNVMDALLDLPSVAGGLTNESAGFNYANTGMNTLNLRNLGHERTLILINGRRVVSSDVGELLSDMNAIPTSMVKRIDITTGGGSATYGSGAIAGVVNFILKDDFEGFQFEARRNQSPKSDNISDSLRLTYGGNFANDNGNAVINIEHSSSEGLASSARGVTGVRFDTDKNVLNPAQLSSYAPKWRYDIGDYQTGWQEGQAVDWDLAQDGYRHADSRTISTPIDRLIINLNSHLYLADNVRLFSEISYAKTQTSNPSDLYWIGSKTSRGEAISIDNPFVPEALKKMALAKGVDSIDYRGRLNEFGTTGFKSERIVSRYVLGLDGTIGDNWDWEISYNYGEVSNDQIGRDINQLNFKKATDVVVDAQTGEIRCADQAFVDIGCVPTDVFAPFTPEQMKFWGSQTTLDGKLEEQILSGSVSNSSLFSLPAGDVGFAAGIEHRREYAEEFPDSVTASGMSGGLQIDGLQGEYEVDEVFVEFEVPLLSDSAYAKSLVLNVSGRVSDYSHSGRNNSWQLGSRWEV
ncbi:MAG: TonB-dependent receptor plug domain-containing protein, partial [Psychrosphaera sp.]|nr:TonB-dependent receptor plug domain-containing protein [Psychrosphaera sp.]